MDGYEFISFDELYNVYEITREELNMIDSSFIGETNNDGVWLYISDKDENGLPDFYDSQLGIDVILKPSQGVVFG